MAKVVTAVAGSVSCDHKGLPELSGADKLTVEKKQVVLHSAAAWTAYPGCKFSDASGPKPCSSTVPTPPGTSGKASKLTVGREPVLLDDFQATTAPAGSKLTVEAKQQRLTAE